MFIKNVCVWPAMTSVVCVFVNEYGSRPEQSSGGPLASLTLARRGVEEISSPPPLVLEKGRRRR